MTTRIESLSLALAISLIGPLTAPSMARADTVPINGYDVEQVPQSGCGGWSYSYSGGVVLDTGRKMCCQPYGPPPGCSLAAAVPVLNFSGGSGTLADGVALGTSITNTELFFLRNDFVGQPIEPVITLHLGGTYLINTIRFYGGDFVNLYPGALNGVTVEIQGHSLALPTVPTGPKYYDYLFNTDDVVDLSGSGLNAIPTNTIVLRNFTTAPFFGSSLDQFSITEITVDGKVPFAGVPGDPDCTGASVSALMQQYHGMPVAAEALGFTSVRDIQNAISVFCH